MIRIIPRICFGRHSGDYFLCFFVKIGDLPRGGTTTPHILCRVPTFVKSTSSSLRREGVSEFQKNQRLLAILPTFSVFCVKI